MTIWIASMVLILGALFALIAALGVVRMPDIYCRIHAAAKAGAFGASLILLALILAAPSLRVIIQSAMIVGFFYLTAPIAAHMIGRVARLHGTPLWRPPAIRGSESIINSEKTQPHEPAGASRPNLKES